MSLNISDRAREAIWQAEQQLSHDFRRVDAVESVTQARVLDAFQSEQVSARHFAPTNGYGYDDIGRDTLERVFAHALQAEAACVRPQIVNGTHAIYLALSALTEPGDTILSLTGSPYDTLEEAIGIRGDAPCSLKRFGIHFKSIPLAPDGSIDLSSAANVLRDDPSVRIVYFQRSRGYAWRNSLSVAQLSEAYAAVRNARSDVYLVTDNCYGEFVEAQEPTAVGADLIAGSLIKNPGGGLAPSGGYAAGTRTCVERVQHRLSVPGMGGEVGSYAASYQPFYQGLFMAPHVTAQCIKSALLFARAFEMLGCETMPGSHEVRSDIIQAIRFPDRGALLDFCRCIQAASPVDCFATPEPWDMPGYAEQVIMAAGTFVQGATSELSADGPMTEPYTAYLQGALTYAHGRIAAMLAYDAIASKLAE